MKIHTEDLVLRYGFKWTHDRLVCFHRNGMVWFCVILLCQSRAISKTFYHILRSCLASMQSENFMDTIVMKTLEILKRAEKY